jgi:TPP-dependent pyruvate/acetoin dehydrogenase alpha subunit
MEERINNPAARLYRSMYLIRRVEEEIIRLYPSDKIKSPVHLSIGQEAVSAAVCDHLERRDYVFGTYRGHALYLAKGGDVPRMMAELYGKVDGSARGKAGPMHLVYASAALICAVVATGISNAVGAALALRMKKLPAIVACFFGEGAVDEGAFHESINFASLKKLAILFVCENNFYAIYSHVKDRLAGPGLCARARAYGVEAELIEDGDPLALHARVGAAIAAVRRGEGPRFLECMTCRWRDSCWPDRGSPAQISPRYGARRQDRGRQSASLGGLAGGDAPVDRGHRRSALPGPLPSPKPARFADREVYDHVFTNWGRPYAHLCRGRVSSNTETRWRATPASS